MKVEVGKKYTLIKAPSMFKNWMGHIFKVTNVSNGEIILEEVTPDDDNYGYTCVAVSPDEFKVYFQPVQEKEKAKKMCKAGKWSDWTPVRVCGVRYSYKTNGKKIIVRSNGYRGESSCHTEDKFDLGYGLNLAISRLNQNKLKNKKSERVMRFGR